MEIERQKQKNRKQKQKSEIERQKTEIKRQKAEIKRQKNRNKKIEKQKWDAAELSSYQVKNVKLIIGI